MRNSFTMERSAMLNVAVVDDEKSCTELLISYLAQFAAEKKREIHTEVFYSGEELLNRYQPQYDIILLDIEMGEMDGMETARQLRSLDQDVVLVFITNMAQYAINGYEVGALDYVLKPITYYTFSVRFERAISRIRKRRPEEFLLPLPEGMQRVRVDQIYYVEVENHTLHYHTRDGVLMVRGSLQSVEEKLKDSHFVKCNHWYLVNLRHVTGIRKNMVCVAGDMLEISRRNKTAFLSALTDYMGMEL
ncbi:MAG: LytTR family DNA-binding domain-containing protein [Eubacteriales bacterium]|nr:LytTR family DNA-binding domain-containing protein [Eubacteriales bacterium]